MYIGTSQSDPSSHKANTRSGDFDGLTHFSPNGEVEGEAMLKKKPQ